MTRISQEAPVPIFCVSQNHEKVTSEGMSSNLKSNLCSLGVELENIVHITQPETIVKTRFVDLKHHSHVFRCDNDAYVSSIDCDEYENQSNLISQIDATDVVIISDYDKGLITQDVARFVCNTASSKGVPIYVDTKKRDISCYEKATFIKLNEAEWNNLIGQNKTFADDRLIITLGSQGARRGWITYLCEQRKTVDVTGAGDVFLAAFVVHHMLMNDPAQAIHFANIAAGISVERQGTTSITLEEVLENDRH